MGTGAGTARRTGAAGTSPAGGRGGAKGEPRPPLLDDLLLKLLGGHDDPRLAKELRDELLEKHPDRDPTPQVVRNTLESLVAPCPARPVRQRKLEVDGPYPPSTALSAQFHT